MKFPFVLFVGLLASCTSPSPPPPDGKLLAQSLCASCHLVPSPSDLDKKTWEEYVLPRMGYMYGIYPHDSLRQGLFEANAGGTMVEKVGLFPEKPIIDRSKWEAIKSYFLHSAPEQLAPSKSLPLQDSFPRFDVIVPTLRLSPPSTTLVDIRKDQVFIGDVHSQTLYQLDANLAVQRAAKVQKGAVAFQEAPDALRVAVMGSFSPSDQPGGFLLELPFSASSRPRKAIPNLQRPVDMDFADLDGDGLEDVVICEYAKWTGKLAWWKQGEGGNYRPQLLRNKPGAIQAHVLDWNQDGLLDILALFGQGDEGVFVYYNQGAGEFTETPLLRFPPSYGSSSMEVMDWEGDGDMDIIYTAGDNADYPPILKPYHGIRLFINQNSSLSEQFFLPMYGAYGTRIRDFDQDGDLDIAAISFFPDFQADPTGGFRYFENNGGDHFKSYQLPEANLGRWLVMDAGDLDDDGDEDIILGSLAFEVIPPGNYVEEWVERGIPFIILENTLKK